MKRVLVWAMVVGAVGGVWVAGAEAARLVVVLRGGNAVAVVDTEKEGEKVVARIPVGEGPHEVATSADGKWAFVSNYGNQAAGASISVVDLEKNVEAGRVELGALRRPHGMVEFGGKIYFTAEGASVVGRIDPVKREVDWVAGTGQAGSHMVAVDESTGRLATANVGSGTVSLIEAPSAMGGAGGGAGVVQVAVGAQPEGVAVSVDGRWVWVGHRVEGRVTVVDTATLKVAKTLAVGGMPVRLAASPDGKTVVACDPVGGKLVLLDTATQEERGRVTVGPGACGIVFSTDGKKAFVTSLNAGEVVVVDMEKAEAVGRIEVGEIPDGIALAEARVVKLARPQGTLGVGLATAEGGGVAVVQVMPGSAAEAGGIKVGDVVTAVNGTKVEESGVMQRLVRRGRAGEVIKIELTREGKPMTLDVKLGGG